MRGIAMAIVLLCMVLGHQSRRFRGVESPPGIEIVGGLWGLTTLIVIVGGW
jgi:hypothetical protein